MVIHLCYSFLFLALFCSLLPLVFSSSLNSGLPKLCASLASALPVLHSSLTFTLPRSLLFPELCSFSVCALHFSLSFSILLLTGWKSLSVVNRILFYLSTLNFDFRNAASHRKHMVLSKQKQCTRYESSG